MTNVTQLKQPSPFAVRDDGLAIYERGRLVKVVSKRELLDLISYATEALMADRS